VVYIYLTVSIILKYILILGPKEFIYVELERNSQPRSQALSGNEVGFRNNEIFWFPKYRHDANCIQIVDYIKAKKALSKNLNPVKGLFLQDLNDHGIYQSLAICCLLKIYGITVKSYIKDKSNDNIFMFLLSTV
jgi:hypothetical protein